jgi:predicted metal-binding membrane protein
MSGMSWLGLLGLYLSSDTGGPICHSSGGSLLADALRPDLLLAWVLMIVAMMGPLLAGPIHHLWHRSFARHRPRAIFLFLTAYVVVWCCVCALLTFGLSATDGYKADVAVLVPLTLILAALWQLLPSKRHALLRCHQRPPLSVFGVRAWLDPIQFAVRLGFWCAVSCWPFMLASMATPSGGPFFMAIGSAIATYEQVFRIRSRPLGNPWRTTGPWMRGTHPRLGKA